MGTSYDRQSLGRLAVGTVVAFALLGAVGTAAVAWQGSGASGLLDSARSAAHVLGLVASGMLGYYAVRARRRFAGGVFATSATYTLAGASMFAAAFLVMELGHGFGVDVLAFVPGMQLRMAVNMVLFTGTVFAFGWAYYRLAGTLEGT